ncbi:solute carrier family 15 member 4-like [Ptychodera flava]|uniref:solute carrier family 15 member 4-like n=1 Tax=Ptychodera flava TaxID=63121 RepID=UPI00396A2AE3
MATGSNYGSGISLTEQDAESPPSANNSPSHEKTPLILKEDSSDDQDKEGNTPKARRTIPFKSRKERLLVIICILCTELCERLTYYSISANLVLFCTSELDLSNQNALTISFVFTGTSYFVPIIGGFIADSIAGKFNAIYGSGLIYFLGAILLPVVAIPFLDLSDGTHELNTSQKRFYYLLGLTLVAIGTGGIKSNVGPFGAQQTEDLGQSAVQTFFSWFYWFINVGSAVAFSVVAYIQQEVSFVIGYLIPAVSILIATILLLIGRNSYVNRPPEGSAYSRVTKILCQSVKRIRSESLNGVEVDSCLDRAKEDYGGSYKDIHVEEVKSLGRIIPVFLTIIPYWTVYFQMQSTYYLQGMGLRLEHDNFTVPISALNLFNIAIILIMIPVMDRLVYPCLENRGIKFTQLRRIGFGMILVTLSVVVAAIVEIFRKKNINSGIPLQQVINDDVYNASNISIFVQIPQFTLIGASEIFTSITGLEFAYSQSPASMQGVVMGMFLLTSGLGSYLGSLLVIIVNAASEPHKWLPDEDINSGYLERFFFLLAVIMLADFFVFIVIAWRYTYIRTNDPLPLDTTPQGKRGTLNLGVDLKDGRLPSEPDDSTV